MGAAQRALISELRQLDAYLDFPAGAEEWLLEDLQLFYDTCGELSPEPPAAVGSLRTELEPEPQPELEPKAELEPELEPAWSVAELYAWAAQESPPAVEPAPEPAEVLEIGGIALPIAKPASPALVPALPPHWAGAASGGARHSQGTLGAMRWMMMQLALGQDMLLLADPGPRPRRLVLELCALLGREVEYVGVSRDTAEGDLRQRREMDGGGSVRYELAPPLRAALCGRVLVLEGVEKAERNVLPLLNNLLENREMALDDGRFLVGPEAGPGGGGAADVLRCSKDFVVVAIGLPQPAYRGSPLDPPLRSRFACHRLAAER
jgi:hypothetical protein